MNFTRGAVQPTQGYLSTTSHEMNRMAGNGTLSGRGQPRAVRERAARPDVAGSAGCRRVYQKRRYRGRNPVRLWCTWYRIAVERAPRKYHKPLTNTVSYGQLLTVENGQCAALMCIWPGRKIRPLFIAKVRVAGSNPVVRSKEVQLRGP